MDKVDVQSVIRKFEKISSRHGIFSMFNDSLAMWAYALSNKFDFRHYGEREASYITLAAKYSADELKGIADIFGDIMIKFSSMIDCGEFTDFLGAIYMQMDAGNKRTGQFFTPYDVSKMMAQICIDGNPKLDRDIITMNEPTCGAGGMVLATADILWNKHKFNYADKLIVVAQDIDIKCVMMTYLQASLTGIPAIIYHADSISMQTWGVWYTPAYLFQWQKFDRALKGDKELVRVIGPYFKFEN